MGRHSFSPDLALNITDVEKFEVGKKLTGWGKNWLVIFFSLGKEWLVSFFPGEEIGRPDPSPGKDWRGEKTDCYTGPRKRHYFKAKLLFKYKYKQTIFFSQKWPKQLLGRGQNGGSVGKPQTNNFLRSA